VKIDKQRLEKYIDQIAGETTDLEAILIRPNYDLIKDQHILKSLKYSTIVIAEAIASTLQHILAKKYNTVVDGYIDVYKKARERSVLTDDLTSQLQPFFSFRSMLVHQYWHVSDEKFLNNLRQGLASFRRFVKEIRAILMNTDPD
jgi:uncharacterized protein YutE (UPF0331/DUF86 family)